MKPALQQKFKKGQPWSHFLFFFLLKEGEGNRNDGADSTVTVMSSHRNSEVNHYQGPRPKKEGQGRGLSPWKHPPWTIHQVGTSTRGKEKTKVKIQWKGPVFDTVFIFSFFLFFFSLNAGFESFVDVFFSVTILISKLEVVTQKKMCMSRLSRCH